MQNLIREYNIPVVRQFEPQTDMKAFLEYVRDLEDLEGFVVRFEDGHMTKLKCDWYVQIHKAKEKILFDRNIVDMILKEKLDDIKAHLDPSDVERLSKFESAINQRILEIAAVATRSADVEKSHGDRKHFALNAAHTYSSSIKQLIFALWDNNSYERALELVRIRVAGHLGRNSKWEELRDDWFAGIVFNQSSYVE